MAGRPKTMAKRVAEIEARAYQVDEDLCALRPARVAKCAGNEGDDDLARMWNEAAMAVVGASFAVADLLCCLEERARLDFEALQQQRDQQRA